MKDYMKHNTAVIIVKPTASTHSALRLINRRLKQAGISILRRTRRAWDVMRSYDMYADAKEHLAWRLDDLNDLELSPGKQKLFKEIFDVEFEDLRDSGDLRTMFYVWWNTPMTYSYLLEQFYALEEGVAKMTIGSGIEIGYMAEWDYYVVSPRLEKEEDLVYYDEDSYTNVLEVMWEPHDLSNLDYLDRVIGSASPEMSHPDSIRHQMYLQWQNLSLSQQPTAWLDGIDSSDNFYTSMIYASVFFQDTTVTEHPLHKALEARGVDFGIVNDDFVHKQLVEYKGQQKPFTSYFYGLDRKPFLKQFMDLYHWHHSGMDHWGPA